MKKILISALIFLATHSTVIGQTFNAAKLDSLFDTLVQNNKGMGTLVLSKNGKVIYSKSVGFASVADNIAATIKTRYRIGSISKMFTAAIIFQLIEEHKLSIDTKLSAYYPQLPNAEKITVGMMLNHRSGLHNLTDSSYLSYYTQPQTHQDMLDIFAGQPSDFEPGTQTAYSNTNFVLLGYIAENISGKPYKDLLKQRITQKLGLKDTYYGAEIDVKNNEALSYLYTGEWEKSAETDMSIPGGAGAIVSTPADLVKFIEGLFAGKLVSDSSLSVMKTMKERHGSGLFLYSFGNKTAYGHNGGIDEFKSTLSYFPAEKLALAFCTNGINYPINSLSLGILNIYFNQPYTIPAFKSVEVADELLEKYTGIYSSKDMPVKITITQKGSSLMAQATGQSAFPLQAEAANRFSFEPAGVIIKFNADNNEMTLKQNGVVYQFVK